MRNRATTPLSKPKVRQSWSKYNLYNLSRFRNPPTANRTFFQQKFTAKSIARTYHGEQVRESQWQRMFTRRLRSVVPMNTAQLARDDGSQISAGRGAGLDDPSGLPTSSVPRTPYTQMTFAPLERRLDVAVFRALFASSARQARQFVVHGAVTVNGKKMRFPGYLLNPGDLFQVEPEMVMYATGAPKDRRERREARVAQKQTSGPEQPEGENEDAKSSTEENKESGENKKNADNKGDVQSKKKTESKENKEAEEGEESKESKDENPQETLKALLGQAKNIMSGSRDVIPARRKQELRGFQRAVRRVLSRSGTSSSVLTDSLEDQFSQLISLLKAKKAEKGDGKGNRNTKRERKSEEDLDFTATDTSNQPGEKLTEAFKAATQDPEALDAELTSELTDEEFDVLKRALVQMRDNPIDHTKPYATPWRPRDYMNAFAFIPRYLEVNQNICAAVYLRHPVARPGYSEVPSPFGEPVGTAAFAWYLRRR